MKPSEIKNAVDTLTGREREIFWLGFWLANPSKSDFEDIISIDTTNATIQTGPEPVYTTLIHRDGSISATVDLKNYVNSFEEIFPD